MAGLDLTLSADLPPSSTDSCSHLRSTACVRAVCIQVFLAIVCAHNSFANGFALKTPTLQAAALCRVVPGNWNAALASKRLFAIGKPHCFLGELP